MRGLTLCLLSLGLFSLVAITAANAEMKPIDAVRDGNCAGGSACHSAFASRPGAAPSIAAGRSGDFSLGSATRSRALQRTLAMSVKGLKSDNPMAGAVILAALSFLYGVVHAVGPGHGKTIISSYVVANEETVRRGVIISFIAAGLQALTAVALVSMLAVRAQRFGASDQCLVEPARKRELCA